jgi:putative hydrolase of the HAD superfamily
MRKIIAVTFDLWDTLIREVPGGSQRVARIRVERIADFLERIGRPQDLEEVEDAYRKVGTFLEMTWDKSRDMPVRDHVLFMLNCMECRLPGKMTDEQISEVERIYAESMLDCPPALLPGASEVLEAVNEKGYRMGLISNTGKTPGITLRKMMTSMGIARPFETMTFSNEILVRKPAETAFRVTLGELKTVPKAAVHIGDDPEKDIEGAKAAGMHAIQVTKYSRGISSAADCHTESLDGVLEALERLG